MLRKLPKSFSDLTMWYRLETDKFPDIWANIHFSLTQHKIPWPWKLFNLCDISLTCMNPAWANRVDPDQAALIRGAWSRSALFASVKKHLYEVWGLKHTFFYFAIHKNLPLEVSGLECVDCWEPFSVCEEACAISPFCESPCEWSLVFWEAGPDCESPCDWPLVFWEAGPGCESPCDCWLVFCESGCGWLAGNDVIQGVAIILWTNRKTRFGNLPGHSCTTSPRVNRCRTIKSSSRTVPKIKNILWALAIENMPLGFRPGHTSLFSYSD